jgi:hypothetical protein
MILQTFECTVNEVGFRGVSLKVRDLTDRDRPDEIWVVPSVRFPKSIQVGSVYIFTIEQIDNSVVSKFSPLELPKLTEAELEEARQEAKVLEDFFKDAILER